MLLIRIGLFVSEKVRWFVVWFGVVMFFRMNLVRFIVLLFVRI